MATTMNNLQAKLDLDSVKNESMSYVRKGLTALGKLDAARDKTDKTEYEVAKELGAGLNDAAKIFKANGHKLAETFVPWACDITGKGKSTVSAYRQIAKHAEELDGIATGFQHARDILAGKCNEDGSYKEEEPKEITDDDRMKKIKSGLNQISAMSDKRAGLAFAKELLDELTAAIGMLTEETAA